MDFPIGGVGSFDSSRPGVDCDVWLIERIGVLLLASSPAAFSSLDLFLIRQVFYRALYLRS